MTGDADLSKLRVINPNVDINFDQDITEYFVSVANNYNTYTFNSEEAYNSELENAMQIYYEIDDENAIAYAYPGELKVGQNVIPIMVVAQNGDVQTYTINVYREYNPDAKLGELKVKDTATNEEYALTPEFMSTYTGPYKVEVEKEVDKVLVEASANAITSTVSGTREKSLAKGDNNIEIMVTAQNGDIEYYRINVIRKKDNNTNVSDLKVKVDNVEKEISPELDNEETEYNVEAPINSDEVEFEITLESEFATYEILDNNKLKAGLNLKRIIIKAEDNTTKTINIYVNRLKEDNNDITSLRVYDDLNNDYNLTEESETKYTLEVENEVTSVNVLGEKASNLATIRGNGKYNLSVGKNEIRVVVTSEAGNEKEYKIEITRKPNSNAYLSKITTNLGILVPIFDKNEFNYTVNVSNNVEQITINGEAEVNTTRVQGNTTYNLNVGDNNIEITTLAEDNITTLTYKVNVKKDQSNNTNLSYLLVEEGALTPGFNKNVVNYEVKVPIEVNEVHLHYETEKETSRVEVTGGTNLQAGSNEVKVKVIAEDNSEKEYIINVVKQEASLINTDLKNILLSNGELNPAFDREKQYYEVEVEKEITTVTVNAKTSDTKATVTGTGAYNLKVGRNLVVLRVTGQNNITKDYQIVIKRLKSKEARLRSIGIKDISLAFDKDTYTYNVETKANSLEYTTIIPYESNATYEVIGNSFSEVGNYEVKIKVTAEDGEATKEYVFNVNRLESNNANLSMLEVEGYQLRPAFNKNTTVYNLTSNVENNIMSVNVKAAVEDPHASIVRGTGIQELVVGNNTINVEVEAEDQTPKTYTINIVRKGSDNNNVSVLELYNGDLTPAYTNATTTYNTVIPYTEDHLDLYVVLEEATASYVINNNANLRVGNNEVKVVVTSESGRVRTITINALREDPITAKLKNLEVEGYQILPRFEENTYNYDMVVDNEIENISVIATPLDSRATYVVRGNENLSVGNNAVEVEVTSRDESESQIYTINVKREAYANNFLKSITTDQGEVKEEFNKYNKNYTIDVDSTTANIEIIALSEDEGATVSGTGIKSLEEGANTFTITVNKDGIKRYYYITVNRNDDSDNYLLTLKAYVGEVGQTISPAFESEVYDYTINVAPSTEKIRFAGTISEKASVSGLTTQNVTLGENNYEIIVRSKNNKERKYNVTVNRGVSTNTNVDNIVPSSGYMAPGFSNNTLEYTLNVGSNIERLSFNVVTSDKFATVSGNEEQAVAVGESQRIITIQAEDETTTKQYTINVKRARPDNANLVNLYVNGYTFEENFEEELLEYHLTVPNSKATLTPDDVVAIASDTNATIIKQTTKPLSTKEENEYTVKVRSFDTTEEKEYKIYITREKSSLTQLDNLRVDRGRLEGEFTPTIKEYDLYVYEDEEKINISATPSNEEIEILSGTGEIILGEEEEIEHQILLQAEDGTTGYYQITIHRSVKTDKGLANIRLNHSEELEYLPNEFVLTPEFESETLIYNVKVPYEYEILDLRYEKENEEQSVKVKVEGQEVENYELSVGETQVRIEVYDGFNVLTRTYQVNVERSKSRNTYLKKLEIEGYELTPEFNKNTQEYYIRVPVGVNELDYEDIKAEAEEETSTININGYLYLIEGNNDLTITVISESLTSREYIVHILKGESKDSDLKNITVSTGVFWPLSPKFKRDIYDYSVVIPNMYDRATVEAVVDDSNLVTISGTGEKDLHIGNNQVILTATSTITGQVSIYTINIIKEADEDVDLVSLSAKEGEISPAFDRSKTKYSINVGEDVEKLTLSYEASSPNARIIVMGNQNFVSGDSKVNIVVTNYEGTRTKTYQIKVNKDKNSNTLLSNIRVYDENNEYEIIPAFDEETHIYNVEVGNEIDKVSIEATTQKETTNIMGNGLTYLNYGSNEVKLTTIAENGNTDEYIVNIYRNQNLDLESLTVSEGELDPEFSANTTSYDVEVGNEIENITIVGVAQSSEVEVIGNGTKQLNVGENVFDIVVQAKDNKYKTYTVKVTRGEDTNNYIKELQVNGILSPIFEKTRTNYEVDVRPDVKELDLDVTLESETATYEVINNTLSADNNPNKVTIRVTAQNGSTRDYELDVTVRDWVYFSNRLRNLIVDHGQLTPDFNQDINNYAVTVSNSVEELEVETVKQNSEQKVTMNGKEGAIQKIRLNVGRNVIKIEVTDPLNTSTSEYSLIAYRLDSADATLSNLMVQGQQFSPYFNKNVYEYELSIGSEIENLNVIATPSDPESTVEISGNTNIPSGESQIRVKVTAPNKVTTKEYIIRLSKIKSSNNYLIDIEVTDYELNETFIKTKQGIYTINVGKDVANILVKGIPEVKTTTVTGDGVINLQRGENTVNIVATAESGEVRTYTLKVIRAKNDEATLREILVSDGELDPAFDKDTLIYEVEVDESVEEVTINGLATDINAKVSGNGEYDLTGSEETTVNLEVTSEDNIHKKTYAVKFIRHVNASSYLKDLIVKDGKLYPSFHKLITTYTILVPNEVRSLDMIYKKEDEGASVEVSGNASFKVGTNKVNIEVTAKDNSSTTNYELSVIRQSKSSNYLKALTVKNEQGTKMYELTPAFDKTKMYYEVYVPLETQIVLIEAQKEDENSTLQTTELGIKSLNSDVNRYYVSVESETGVIRTYQVVVIREAAQNKLLTLTSDKGELSPEFNSEVKSYTLAVDENETSVTLSGTASPGARVEGLGEITLENDVTNHEIKVTSIENEENKYNVKIVRGLDETNTNLNKLIPSSGELTPSYSNSNDNYEVEVADGIGMISFEVEPEDEAASVTGNEIKTLSYGNNNVTIRVLARDGITTRDIHINVVRKKDATSIEVEKEDILLQKDEEYDITYSVKPNDATNKEVEFKSNNTNVATVSNQGKITAINLGTTTIKITSKEKKDVYKIITVRVINMKITSREYEIERFSGEGLLNDNAESYEGNKSSYIIGSEPETTIEEYVSKLDNDPATIHVYDVEGQEINDKSTYIGTGMTIKLEIDGVVYDSLKVVVRGDLDGDGIIAMTDYTKLKSQLLGNITFDYATYKATDLDNDELIAMTDYTKLKSYLLGDIASLNSDD